MKNPAAAILEATGLGLKDFTQESGVAQTTVQELLWGFFPDVPPRLAKALGRAAQEHGVDYEEIFFPDATLNEAYHRWQVSERVKIRGSITYRPSVRPGQNQSPFQEFVDAVAPTGLRSFCTLLKLPRATTQRYAYGVTRNMPTTIKAALEQVEYPYINELSEAQIGWL